MERKPTLQGTYECFVKSGCQNRTYRILTSQIIRFLLRKKCTFIRKRYRNLHHNEQQKKTKTILPPWNSHISLRYLVRKSFTTDVVACLRKKSKIPCTCRWRASSVYCLVPGSKLYLFTPSDNNEAQYWFSDGHTCYKNARMDMPKEILLSQK